ncbi:MAG TPA: 4-hydroxy-tetrahydrodipicolinate reductase, partial [Dehalococcoidia bacterium]|nr:4-hydroxy-tetrahydrodipicolinate reductase [Dehalococcoidia bacterium]
MAAIKVVVTGASGKMSQEVLAALCKDPDLEPVGAVSQRTEGEYLPLPGGAGLVPLSKELEPLLARVKPNVLVDFTTAPYALSAARLAIAHGVRPVIGTSGLAPQDVEELRKLCAQAGLGGIVAPNFALGAVVMMHLANV